MTGNVTNAIEKGKKPAVAAAAQRSPNHRVTQNQTESAVGPSTAEAKRQQADGAEKLPH